MDSADCALADVDADLIEKSITAALNQLLG
jgi:hypothetical protein